MSREAEHSLNVPSSPPPSGAGALSQAFPANGRARQPTIHPPDLDELRESYASPPPDGFSPDIAILEKISDLEAWAMANLKLERAEAIRFWALKGTSFFGAVVAGVGASLTMPRVAVIAAALTAISIAIDAAWPVSGDRNARRRAMHDLRQLQHTLKLKWDKVRLAHPDPFAVKRIAHALALLDAAQAKREEIGRYLSDASPAVDSVS